VGSGLFDSDGVVNEAVLGRPDAALRPFIAWYSGYKQRGVLPGTHRGLPSPYLTLIFTLDEPLTVARHVDPRQTPGEYGTLIGGLHTSPAFIAHQGSQSGVQVTLSPLGARALLGLPAGELSCLDFDAGDVMGVLAHDIRDRLHQATTWPERFEILDRLLLTRLDDIRLLPPEVVRAWTMLRESGGTTTIADLAAEVGWSTRHLANQFATEIGLTPKAAARVIRFDRARRALQQRAALPRSLDLARLANDHGYYDQPHFYREFAALAGCSPAQWLTEEFRNIQARYNTGEESWAS
jgi:AraC-like DNA-binding protein